MRRIFLNVVFAVASSILLAAQTPPTPPPQSARQALIEMFLGKGGDDFLKHLPEAARQALMRQGELPENSAVMRAAMIGRQMVSQGEHLETFDEGATLLVSDQHSVHEKVEIMVEHDSLLGEEEEIELSVHVSKDGQPISLRVVPRLIFTMKQEKEIWRLTEVTVAGHVPLTDPDYLHGLRRQQDEAYEAAAQMRVGVIAAAETGYVARHPDRGYTCTLATLFAQEPEAAGEQTGEEGGVYYDPGQGSGEWNGYRFALSGCDGNPASKFRITAVPVEPDPDAKTFCDDESETLRFVAGGKPSSCFSRGQVVNTGVPVVQGVE